MKPWSNEVCGLDSLHSLLCDGHVGRKYSEVTNTAVAQSFFQSSQFEQKGDFKFGCLVSCSVISPSNEISIELAFGGSGMLNDLHLNT